MKREQLLKLLTGTGAVRRSGVFTQAASCVRARESCVDMLLGLVDLAMRLIKPN